MPRWMRLNKPGATKSLRIRIVVPNPLARVGILVTLKIDEIVDSLKSQGEVINKEDLAHISLLPFRHVIPNGTYFIDDM